MTETIKNTKGITLIALVITIIVLLILAILTIRIITTGGIIEHAKNGAMAYNDAQTNELELLTDIENKMAANSGENSKSTISNLIPTTQEKEEMLKVDLGWYIAIDNNKNNVLNYIEYNTYDLNNYPIRGKYLALGLNGNTYYYVLAKEKGQENDGYTYYQNDNSIGSAYILLTCEVGKWYVLQSSEQLTPWTSQEKIPFTASDFTDQERIFGKTYFNRLLNS